ncbi:MAG: hypothetical protein ACE5IB_04285 [Candidatus Geothermarchaeales archaeon]
MSNRYVLMKYFLISYMLIWLIATPIMLLGLYLHGIPFSTEYEVYIGSAPLYLTTLTVYVSALPSYYIPASAYFKKSTGTISKKFIVRTALVFWGLSMFLDLIFVVLVAGINILAYPFDWIYLGVGPVMIMSVCLAGIRNLQGGEQNGKNG